jgi:DNA-binding transcriptional regulator YhcF (GntR family)
MPSTREIIYFYMLDNTLRTDEQFAPSINQIKKDTGASDTATRRVLKEMDREGYFIKIDRNKHYPYTRFIINPYSLVLLQERPIDWVLQFIKNSMEEHKYDNSTKC